MSQSEPYGQRVRVLAVVVLLVCLGVLFVWGGSIPPDPATNDYPANDDVGPAPETYVGQQVELSGTVVATDPVVVEIDHGFGETTEIHLRNLDDPVSVGDRVNAFGTLLEDSTLAVEDAIVRKPWEFRYMYVVSFFGGLWVLGRLLRQWRLDVDRLAVVSRGGDDA